MAIIDDFKARFPEFTPSVVDDRLPNLILVYPCYFNGDYENDKCDHEAILQLLAHLLVIETTAGSGGAAATGNIQSKSVGSVSVSYKAASSIGVNQDFFGGTKYGLMFLMLSSKRGVGAYFV